MSDSMVERVARAMWAMWGNYSVAPPGAINWDSASEELRDIGRAYARAAIQAMREPDKAMLNAACAAMSPGKRPTQKRVSVKAKHGIRYRAMIDAALKESP